MIGISTEKIPIGKQTEVDIDNICIIIYCKNRRRRVNVDEWVLRNRISRYKGMIAQNEQEIYALKQRLQRIKDEKPKLTYMQEQIMQSYTAKRGKCNTYAAVVRGRAVSSAFKMGLDIYSCINCNTQISRLENIKIAIDANASKIDEMIAEMEWENNNYFSEIRDCEWEIVEVKRRERKEKNAGFNSKR